MKILITGGTGFIGTHLTARLLRAGHEITILTRSARTVPASAGLTYLEGNPAKRGTWQESVGSQEVLINLAGASIFSRWTEEYKTLMVQSRRDATLNLVEGISARPDRPVALFSASAVGYYGFHGDEELTEESPRGDDFLARLAVEWEQEAREAEKKGARVVITRFGIVLGEKGGALGQMVPLFEKFVGGPIGSGRQWFSWIHVQDLAEAVVFLIDRPEISGPVNFTAPQPVRNRDLAASLGRTLHRPSILPAPAFMVRLALGEFGSVILKGQRVIPRRLLDSGFIFRYPEIDQALLDILRVRGSLRQSKAG